MKAFVIRQYKGPLEATDVPEPVFGEHDFLIQVRAAGLNQLDEKIRTGEFKQILPNKFPLILGHDVAGVVLRVGMKVKAFKPGDEVYGRPRQDTLGHLPSESPCPKPIWRGNLPRSASRRQAHCLWWP